MVPILFRAVTTVLSAVVGVAVVQSFGETPAAKVAGAVLFAGLVAAMEWAMAWAPRHSARARHLLDPRSVMSGSWWQRVVHAEGDDPVQAANMFGLYVVEYRPSEGYVVNGTAYDRDGTPVARWGSIDATTFSRDGTSMFYMFDGTVLNDPTPRRSGITNIRLNSPVAGTGRVEHVSLNRSFDFDCHRTTEEWLREHGVSLRERDLGDPERRDQVARRLAEQSQRQDS